MFFVSLHLERDKKRNKIEYKRKNIYSQSQNFTSFIYLMKCNFLSLWLQNLTLKMEAQCTALISQNTKTSTPL